MGESPENDLWCDCPHCQGTGEVEATPHSFAAHMTAMYEEGCSAGAIADQVREYVVNDVVPCVVCEGSGRLEVV